MEQMSEDGTSGFFIADDADPTVKLEMRVMALHNEHKEFYDRLRNSEADMDLKGLYTNEEYDTFIKSLDKGLADIQSIFDTAVADTPTLVDPEDFAEAITHVGGLRLHLLRGKAMQNLPTVQ